MKAIFHTFLYVSILYYIEYMYPHVIFDTHTYTTYMQNVFTMGHLRNMLILLFALCLLCAD